MVCVLVSRLNGPGSSPGWAHSLDFTLTVPLSTLVYKWVHNYVSGVNPTMD